MTGIGRKILVKAETDAKLADLLRMLIFEIEAGHNYMNATSIQGLRMMRPLREDEPDFYMNVQELP